MSLNLDLEEDESISNSEAVSPRVDITELRNQDSAVSSPLKLDE